jgi:hypothetical protein
MARLGFVEFPNSAAATTRRPSAIPPIYLASQFLDCFFTSKYVMLMLDSKTGLAKNPFDIRRPEVPHNLVHLLMLPHDFCGFNVGQSVQGRVDFCAGLEQPVEPSQHLFQIWNVLHDAKAENKVEGAVRALKLVQRRAVKIHAFSDTAALQMSIGVPDIFFARINARNRGSAPSDELGLEATATTQIKHSVAWSERHSIGEGLKFAYLQRVR